MNLLAQIDRLKTRSRSYKACFMDEREHMTRAGEIVLADLKRFCRLESSTVTVSPVSRIIDPLAMALAEGRREVALRIVHYLNLDERTIARLNENDTKERDDFAA
jgi:hypothetical protein